MSSVKRETCEEQLRRICKDIADDITAGKEDAHKWMEGVYNIEWITHRDKSYKAASLMVAGGGPSIWVNLQTNTVQGYWWGDYCEHSFQDNIGLDDYCGDLYDGH